MLPQDQEQSAAPNVPNQHDPYAALRVRDFRWYLAGHMLALIGIQAQTFAVSWEIYEITRSNLALAFVGLVQVWPVIGLFLYAGHVADRFERRRILMASLVVIAGCSLGLTYNSAIGGEVRWFYVYLFGIGVARSFMQPARASLLPLIVPRDTFSSAVTWNSGGFQLAMVIGPAVGGGLIWLMGGATLVYLLNAILALAYAGMLATIASRPGSPSTNPLSFRTLVSGLDFVWRARVIMGAITLDMFAVLLGGATALLPVYAKEILDVGPATLSWMRAAPGIGALCMSLLLAHRPPLERAGRALLWSVAGFGIATIVFGLSRSLLLSLVMLFLLGALDMVSVVVRHTLVQVLTPDEIRGRVSAVNGMFIGVSNELGEFESGFVAHLFSRAADPAFGPIVSVVSGGCGTLFVVAAVAIVWPQVRRYGRLGGDASS